MPSLWPCADCARYIRSTEVTCPFCGAAVAPRALAPDTLIERPPRVARSALVALAAAIATGGLPGCTDRAPPPPPPPQFVSPSPTPPSSTPEQAKPTPTATIEVVASPPQPAPPPPVIPPVVTRHRTDERLRQQQLQQQQLQVDDQVDEHIRVAPPYGAPPPPSDREAPVLC